MPLSSGAASCTLQINIISSFYLAFKRFVERCKPSCSIIRGHFNNGLKNLNSYGANDQKPCANDVDNSIATMVMQIVKARNTNL
jgi:hypothetical protein